MTRDKIWVFTGAVMICLGMFWFGAIIEKQNKLKDKTSMGQRFRCEVEQLPTSEAGLKRHYAVECTPVEITREM